jgi:hypothetical protein
MEQLRLEAGLGGTFGEWSYQSYGILATDCWMQTLWQFCSKNDLAIHDTCPQLEPARNHDRYLTEIFVTFGYSGETLVWLNEYRMWLKTIMVADITTANGKEGSPLTRGMALLTTNDATISYGHSYKTGLDPITGTPGDTWQLDH